MRSTTKSLLILFALVLGASVEVQAQSATSAPGGSVTCVLTVVVPSFVKMVAVPADPATGAPATVKVVTNDPRLRAQLASAQTTETFAPQLVAYHPGRSAGGGEAAMTGRVDAAPTIIRTTVAMP